LTRLAVPLGQMEHAAEIGATSSRGAFSKMDSMITELKAKVHPRVCALRGSSAARCAPYQGGPVASRPRVC
jgi:hypothetical protein